MQRPGCSINGFHSLACLPSPDPVSVCPSPGAVSHHKGEARPDRSKPASLFLVIAFAFAIAFVCLSVYLSLDSRRTQKASGAGATPRSLLLRSVHAHILHVCI